MSIAAWASRRYLAASSSFTVSSAATCRLRAISRSKTSSSSGGTRLRCLELVQVLDCQDTLPVIPQGIEELEDRLRREGRSPDGQSQGNEQRAGRRAGHSSIPSENGGSRFHGHQIVTVAADQRTAGGGYFVVRSAVDLPSRSSL